MSHQKQVKSKEEEEKEIELLQEEIDEKTEYVERCVEYMKKAPKVVFDEKTVDEILDRSIAHKTGYRRDYFRFCKKNKDKDELEFDHQSKWKTELKDLVKKNCDEWKSSAKQNLAYISGIYTNDKKYDLDVLDNVIRTVHMCHFDYLVCMKGYKFRFSHARQYEDQYGNRGDWYVGDLHACYGRKVKNMGEMCCHKRFATVIKDYENVVEFDEGFSVDSTMDYVKVVPDSRVN